MSDNDSRRPSVTTIAIAATFTAEPVVETLRFWMQETEIPARIVLAPYNQVFQQLLDQAGLLATNDNGINVVLLRLEDWQSDGGVDDDRETERDVVDFVRAVARAAERSSTPHLICLCPASPAQVIGPERIRFVKRMEDLVASELTQVSGVNVMTPEELAAAYPVAEYFDPHGTELARMPYMPLFYTALGTMIARNIYALRNTRYKVIVLDCDQTLWGGVCGEDGPLGVRIDSTRQAVQEFMLRQHDAGMLLSVCSKNNEEDVAEVFASRSDMVLRREHIVSWRLNWKLKSENLKSLARELRLGLDSFIFIDDDPVECAEVMANCPEVLTLQLPRNPEEIPRFLRHTWAFDRLKITDVGRERTALYRQDAQRERLRMESLTLKDFFAGLGLKIEISALAPHALARASELTERTNQFNVTTIGRSEREIQELLRSGEAECRVVHVRDRFGDYGLVGVIIFAASSDALVVDTFLLSCRALGRGVEHRMLAKLGDIARERGVHRVAIPYVPTKKNRPALDFLEAVGARFKDSGPGGFVFRVPTEFAVGVAYDPDRVERAREVSSDELTERPAPDDAREDSRPKAALLSSIALELYSAERIQRAVSAQRRSRPRDEADFVAPRTPLEQKVAEMWSEVLGYDEVGVHDNFFDLGGHSLLAMQILSRMRETFQVELSPRLLVSGEFTVAGLTNSVLKEQIGQADSQEIGRMLKRLEELSDDDVRTLLGGSQPEKESL